MIIKTKQIILAIFLFCLFCPALTHAFPNEMKAVVDLTGLANQADQMYLTSDNSELYFTSNGNIYVVDLGYFDLSATQPYDLALDTDIDFSVIGVTLSPSAMYGTQETSGYLLTYNLSDITAKPVATTMSANTDLGKVAITSDGTKLYMVDNDNKKILLHTIGSTSAPTPIALSDPGHVSSFNILDMVLVQQVSGGVDYVYVTTDKGIIFYIVDGSTLATVATIDSTYTHNLPSLVPDETKALIYVIDSTANTLSVRTSTNPANLVATVNFTVDSDNYNQDLETIVSPAVTNPTANYTFTSGRDGVSITNASYGFLRPDGTSGTDEPIGTDGNKGPMVASTDSYIYMSSGGGDLVVITDNPWIEITNVVYSSGSSLTVGGYIDVTFNSDSTGTATFRGGGTIARTGTLMVDENDASSWDVVADTDYTLRFYYDDNPTAFQEGDNDFFAFVVDSSSRYGRRATSITVDTPPAAVVVTGTNFGNTRMYLYVNRLTATDMSYYNIYVSTDPQAVIDRTPTPLQLAQPSSGSSFTAEINGLTNDTLYYASIEGVDTGGLVGALTYTLPDGTTRIYATPQETFGPLSGEKGCSLAKNGGDGMMNIVMVALMVAGLLIAKRVIPAKAGISDAQRIPAFAGMTKRRRVVACFILLVMSSVFLSKPLHAVEASPQWWSTELKGGFWMPMGKVMKDYFSPCCNMTAQIQQGFIYDSKYGAEIGVAFLSENGKAKTAAGVASGDTFNLFLLPVETNFAFHADFKEDQLLVPYVKSGIDYVYYRQNLKGAKTTGWKYGMHGVLGVQILLDNIDKNMKLTMEQDYKINDVYFTLEGKYSWINNFGGKGVDFSNLTCQFGLLFQY